MPHLQHTIKVFILVIGLALSSTLLVAQFYPAKLYSLRDGMPTNSIYDITQSADGMMWFLTSKGVARYNSLHWKLYPDSLGLPMSPYSYVKGLPDGTVWVAGQSDQSFNVQYWFEKKWYSVKTVDLDSMKGKFSFDITSTDNGYEGVVAQKNRLHLFTKNKENTDEISFQNASFSTINSVQYIDEILHIATDSGLYILEDSISLHPVVKEIGKVEILQIFYKDEKLYLMGKNWIGVYEDRQFRYLSKNSGVEKRSHYNKHNLTIDQFGRVFYSSMSSAHFLDQKTGTGNILYINGRVFNAQSNRIFVDSENNVWVGDHRGLFKFNVLRFQNYNENMGLAEEEVTAISPFEDHLVLANSNHLNFLRNGTVEKLVSLKEQAGNRVLDLAYTKNGNLYLAANRGGLQLYNNGQLKRLSIPFDSSPELVTSVEYFSDKLYFSTATTLYTYQAGLFEKQLSLSMRNIIPFNSSTLALCTKQNGIVLFDSEKQKAEAIESKSNLLNNTYDICRWNGQYYVATASGVATIQGTELRPYPELKALEKVAIYSLFVSKSNNLWMGTNEGIYIWDGKDLTNYNKAHGLVGDEVNRNAFLQLNDKEVWIGTEVGASVYNYKEDVSVQLIPKLKLTQVSVQDQLDLVREKNPVLEYDENTIDFHFLGVSYFDERQINYRYRLEGFDQEWMFIDNPNANSVRYTNLPPGAYEFKVQSSLENNDWSETESFPFLIEKPFYQTYWFLIILIMIIFLLLYSIYRIRFYYILKNQKKLKSEVRVRTLEIQSMNDEIQAQNQALKIQSEKIRTTNERLEEMVYERTQKLQEQNERLSKYAFMNSHELRAPICRLIGLLNLLPLTEKEEHEKIHQLIYETGMELDLVTRNINNILDSSDFSVFEEYSRTDERETKLRITKN